jgi:transcriptional regulator with XRE-family HTH domain
MTDTPDTNIPSPEQPEQQQEPRTESRQSLLVDIGRRLHEAREKRQISLDEVARELKLRAVYLAALEQGDWDTLPGDVYGIGFTRQYAHFLDIDLEEDVARIKSGEYQLTKPLTFPDPPIAPAKRWAVTAALLFILLLIAFNIFHSANREHQQAAVPAPVTPPPVSSPVTPNTTKPPVTAAPQTPASQPAAPQAQPAPETAAPPAAVTGTSAPTHTYEFYAIGEDVWLQLYRKEGDLIKEALLRNGQHMSIDSDSGYLIMNCGNVGALQVNVDGKPLIAAGKLGPMGKVIKDYRLVPPTQ